MKPLLTAMLWVAVTGAAAAQREAAPVRVLVDTDAGQIELAIDKTQRRQSIR